MARFGRIFSLIVLCLLMCGCARDQAQIVVPVAGLLPDRDQQRAALREMLSQTFPKLRPVELDAIDSIARGFFVTNVARHRAYQDYALPIGSEQSTLKMTDIGFILAETVIKPADKILEIGTGTGYLTAILSRLGAQVYSVEINEYLSEIAQQNIKRFQMENVHIYNADGLSGWSQHAPYDVIIVTASVREIPAELLSQSNEGARLAVPLRGENGVCKWMVYQIQAGEPVEMASRESNVPDAVVVTVPEAEEGSES